MRSEVFSFRDRQLKVYYQKQAGNCEANVSLEWKIVEFDMCRRRKIWIVASKFLYAFTIILQSWMITIIVEISVIFWKLGFWGCSNLALLQDQTLQVHNQTSSID